MQFEKNLRKFQIFCVKTENFKNRRYHFPLKFEDFKDQKKNVQQISSSKRTSDPESSFPI